MTYFLMEATGSVKSVQKSTPTKAIFTAVLQEANEVNRNRRYYPKEVISEAIESANERIRDRIFGGELDHPIPTSDEQYSMIRHVTPSLKEMSHIITETWWEGNKLVGTIETTSTPHGYILAGLIHDKVKVGFSIRALSDNVVQREDGVNVVNSPMTIIAIDAVSIPSHKGAVIKEVKQLESFLMEAKQMNCKGGVCTLSEHLNKLSLLTESTQREITGMIYEFYKGNPIRF